MSAKSYGNKRPYRTSTLHHCHPLSDPCSCFMNNVLQITGHSGVANYSHRIAIRFMGYGVNFHLYQLGKARILWGFTGYGLSEVWFKRVPTVVPAGLRRCRDLLDNGAVPLCLR
ncbi:hypothetical protein C8Q78DRAFT_1018593 [Trametes maxima]|nr:hypothetical protein C8Q78DRAFT_1018593 [Trametes maxima]